jgi:hypothetical protein
MQTDARLFVAAKESSFDWLTSYDCLKKVEHGYTADVPPETAPGPDGVVPTGDGAPKTNGDGAKPDNGKGKAKDPPTDEKTEKGPELRRSGRTGGRKTPDPVLAEAQKFKVQKAKLEAIRVKAAAAKKRKAKEDAGYDYEYEKGEFTRPKKALRTYQQLHVTHWYEATDGQREWYISHILPDSSPPTSPPRAVLENKVERCLDPTRNPG